MLRMDSRKQNILIVDDKPENLKVLMSMLNQQGYQVRPAISGRLALTASLENKPDLILLDITMPQMNGYEVCQHLKEHPHTCDVPVIFISALDEAMDKVKAFEVGGIDYVTKPFQVEEVLARVETHLSLRHLQQQLEQTNQQLSETNATLQERNAELDAFARTVAHDINNPIGTIVGYASYLRAMGDKISLEELNEKLDVVEEVGQKAANIVRELLLLAGVRGKTITPQPLQMTRVMEQVEQRLAFMIKEYDGELTYPQEWPIALGYGPWIEEVWANYISNGLKYCDNSPKLELGATCQPDDMIRFWVRDNGPGISPEEQAHLFVEFTRLNEVKADGHGLGLSIVRRIIDKLGGQVGVESEVGEGSLFYFTLPAADKSQN